MPIVQGPMRGRRWVVGSATHGCWLGTYELAKQERLLALLRPHVAYDIGAHVGYYTLLLSTLVGAEGHVYSFEPLPRNLGYLRRHLEVNRLNNVTVVPMAVSAGEGQSRFDTGGGSFMGALSTAGDLDVKTVSIDNFVLQQQSMPPDFLKIDVEGAEFDVLRGAQRVIRKYRPTIALATHGQAVHQECCALLSSLGYKIDSIDGSEVVQTDEIIAFARS